MTQKIFSWSKLSSILLAILIVGSVVAYIIPNDKVVEVNVPGETVEVPVEVPCETETIEVEVDNGNLDVVLDHIYDNDGLIEYLTEDLDDDEIEQIVDRIVFVNEAKALAVNATKDDGIDALNKEYVDINENETVRLDDDDIERFRVNDDDDEVIVDDIDFDDSDAEVTVTVKFEQDDVKYKASFIVEIRDGEVDDIVVDSISLR